MLEDYMKGKADFSESLTATLRGINEDVSAIKYSVGVKSHNEIVTIEYRNGYTKLVNVTGDSLKALAIDVIEAL